jgi:zinc-ribbon domain
MTLQYRICHNCGASLTSDQAFCPRCGAQYIESVFQEPGVPLPPQQAQVPYQQQGQGFAQPPTSSPSYPSSYEQQAHMTPGQVGGSPQPPPSQSRKGVSPFLIIAIVVVALLVLVGIGSLFYNLGQRNSSQPGTTPIPGITPVPTPTQGTTPVPTPTPQITPRTTPTATAFRALVRIETACPSRISESSNTSVPYVLFNSHSGDKGSHFVWLCPTSYS